MNMKTIYLNRRKIIKNAIETGHFDLEAFAKFYQTKTKLIKDDIKTIYPNGFDIPQTDQLSFPVLKDLYQHYVNKKEKEGLSKDQILENMGMWHEPIETLTTESVLGKLANYKNEKESQKPLFNAIKMYMKEPSEEYLSELYYQAESYIPHFNECLDDFQNGQKIYDIKEKYHLTNFEIKKFSDLIHLTGFKNTPDLQLLSHPEIRDIITDALKNNKAIDIQRCTGFSNDIMQNLKLGNYDSSNLFNLTNMAENKLERQETVWKLYNLYGTSHGLTQQEIADKLGVTRATVNHDLREYKQRHPELIDETQLYRTRHAGERKYQIREQKKQFVEDAFLKLKENYPNLSDSEIKGKIYQLSLIKDMNLDYDSISLFCYECNLIKPHQKITETDKTRIIDQTVIGYEHKGQFGKGATPEILEQYNYQNDREKNNIRNRVLSDQRKTMALLRNSDGIRQMYKEMRGDISAALQINQEMELEIE